MSNIWIHCRHCFAINCFSLCLNNTKNISQMRVPLYNKLPWFVFQLLYLKKIKNFNFFMNPFCHAWMHKTHLFSVFISEQKLHYTFSFPNTGSNFTCISSQSCPQMNPPPLCPPGYIEVRENKTCGLNCRDIVGNTWRCPCNDWMSCAVKERYLIGCASGYYSSFRVRECAQGLFIIR